MRSLMSRFSARRVAVIAMAILLGGLAATSPFPSLRAQSLASPTFTAAQATRGKDTYAQSCASCHGANVDDGEFAPPLKGPDFRGRWGGKPVDAVFTEMSTRMPPAAPGSLGDDKYADVLAFLLQENAVAPAAIDLPFPYELGFAISKI